MKLSNLFTKTSKTVPADETARNAQLLIQAGYVYKVMAGVYAYLPLGKKVLDNISNIVRSEMNSVGGQEVKLTVLQPKEIFEKTDRWDDEKVDNWFKTKLLNGTELGMGLTHEEPVVDTLGHYVNSYKDLPLAVYQIGDKFRNELRAKSGLMRGREFVMKDMYSMARSQHEHEEIYENIAEAYARVYERLGIGDITFRTKADGGIFTDKFSDEFQTKSPIGEDTIFAVSDLRKYYNAEVAPSIAPKVKDVKNTIKDMEEVEGVGVVGVEELAKYLKIPVEQTTKTLIYETSEGDIIAAAVRGGYDINEIKLRKVLNTNSLKLASEDVVRKITGAEVGYAGIIGLPDHVRVIIDESCLDRVNFEMGANKTNFHNINVNWGIDLELPKETFDIKQAKSGDISPETNREYETFQAVEVGNIFSLESKYTDALGVYIPDDTGERQSIIMGCYGIGVSRLLGLIAEHFADDKGLVWPKSVAPALVYIARLGDDREVVEQADALYTALQDQRISVLYDDRDMRPGEKFGDADLLGIPYRVVVSRKTIENAHFEVKERQSNEPKQMSQDDLIAMLVQDCQTYDI